MAAKTAKKSISVDDIYTGKKIVIKPLRNSSIITRVTDGAQYPRGDYIIRASVDGKKYRYNVDLSEEEIMLLEELLGTEISLTFNPEKPNWFWDINPATKVILKSGGLVLNIIKEDPYSYVRYKVLMSSPLIARSLEEYENGKVPKARFYIEDEEYEVNKKADSVSKTIRAYSLLNKLTRDQKEIILSLIYGADFTKMSNTYLDVRLDEVIKNNTSKFIEYASYLLDGKEEDKAYLTTKALINIAVTKGIIFRSRNGSLHYENLSFDNESEMIAFLNKKENTATYLNIKEKIYSR